MIYSKSKNMLILSFCARGGLYRNCHLSSVTMSVG